MDQKPSLFFPSVLAFLLTVLLAGLTASYPLMESEYGLINSFIDLPSLILVIFSVIFITRMRFSWGDMQEAIGVLFDRTGRKRDWFRIDYFWRCVIRNLLMVGALWNIIGAVLILQNLENPDALAPSLAVCMLTLLYSTLFCLLLPIPALFICRRSSAAGKSQSIEKTWTPRFSHKIAGLFAVALIFTGIQINTSFLAFIDEPSFYLVAGTAVGVYLLSLKMKSGAILAGLAFVLLVIYSGHTAWLCLLALPLCYLLMRYSPRINRIPRGELMTVTFSLVVLFGGFWGIMGVVQGYNDPSYIGPHMAIALLTSFYGFLGLIFISLPMEDKNNMIKRRTNEFALSHILWYIFPILTQVILLVSMFILILSIAYEDFASFYKSISGTTKTPLLMLGIWLAAMLVFLIGFAVAQFVLLVKSFDRIQRAQAQLVRSEKLASLGQLVAGVAHEINNPINFIRSNIEPLKDYLFGYKKLVSAIREDKDQLTESLRAKFEKMYEEEDLEYADEDSENLIQSFEDGSVRIARIVTDLRQYSRVDEDYYSQYDLREAIDGTLTLLESRYKKHVTVHKKYGEPVKISCSPGKMNQVFMNLLGNAEESIEGKGNVWIATYREDDKFIVSIRDDGKGISEAERAKIFDPFFTTKPVGAGTGLGLSITHGIIEQHGGTIAVESEEDKGTTFIISLPVGRTEEV